jgi:beta-lactam-binding protein with PASTA domain
MAFSFSAPGLVLGAVFAEKVEDPQKKAELELLGGMFGSSPLGLVLVATLANQAQTTGTGQSTGTGTGTGAEAQVPDVTSARTDQNKARDLIVSRGLTLAATATVTSDHPIKAIVGTSPPAGTIVPIGTAVTLLVSAGIEVPDVVKMPLRKAVTTLHHVGLEVSDDSTVEKPNAHVTRQSPEAGTLVSVGTPVTLRGTEHSSGSQPSHEPEPALVTGA